MNKKIVVILIFLIALVFNVNAVLDTNDVLAYYKFDGNALDSKSTNNGTVDGATNNLIYGKINEGYDFDGINDEIMFSTFTNVKSLSFWINPDVSITTTTPSKAIFGRDLSDYFLFGGNSGGAVVDEVLSFQTSGNNFFYWTEADISAINKEYNFLVFTFPTSTSAFLSINGSTPIEASQFGTPTLGDLTDMALGSRDGSLFFDGQIDEFGVWSKNLTSIEILELYNNNSGLQYPFLAPTPPSNISINETYYNFQNYSSDNLTIYDEFGINNGTLVNFPSSLPLVNSTTTEAGVYLNQSLSFDGVNDYISVDGSTVLNENMTISLWANQQASTSSFDKIFGHYNSGNRIYLQASTTSSKYQWVLGAGETLTYSNTEINNIWTNFLITINNGNAEIYRNGISNGNFTYTGLSSFSDFELGALYVASAGNFWEGLIDEFRIYNYSLTPEEIINLYLFNSLTNPNTVVIDSPLNNSYINYDSLVINYTSNANTICNLSRTNNSVTTLLETVSLTANVTQSYIDNLTIDQTYIYSVSCNNYAINDPITIIRDTTPPTISISYEDNNIGLAFNYNVMLSSPRTLWYGNFAQSTKYFDNTYLDIADNTYRVVIMESNYDNFTYTTTTGDSGTVTVTSTPFIENIAFDVLLDNNLSQNYIYVTAYDKAGNVGTDNYYYYKPQITYSQPTKKHFLAGPVNFFNVSVKYNNALALWGNSGGFNDFYRFIVNNTYYDLTLISDNSNSTFTDLDYSAIKSFTINESNTVNSYDITSQIDLFNEIGTTIKTNLGISNLDIYQDTYTISDMDVGLCGESSWLIYPFFNFTFRDEHNNNLIETDISLDVLLGDNLFTVETIGSFIDENLTFCTNINPDNFTKDFYVYGEIIVSKTDYVTRVFKLDQELLLNGSSVGITQFNLYLPSIDNSTTIQFIWQTKEFQLIDGTMYIYKCNGDNEKILIDSTSISDGSASSNLQLLDTAYSYSVLYDGVLYDSGSYSDCHVETSTSRTFYVDIIEQQISPVIGLFSVDCSLTKQSNDTILMTWGSNEENTDDEITGCLTAYYTTNQGRTIYNQTCNTDELILSEFINPGTELLIVGTITQNNNTGYCRDEITLFYNNDNINTFGKGTLFFVIILIIAMALLFASEGVILLFGAATGIIVSYFLGVLILPKMVVSSMIFFLLIIGLIGRYFIKK